MISAILKIYNIIEEMLTWSWNASKRNEIRQANQYRHESYLLPLDIVMFQGYLSVKDVSILDIAICDVDLRSLFLNSLPNVKIRDDTAVGRGDEFVTWVIKRSIKLLNFKGREDDFFTVISADKIAAGSMDLSEIEDFQLSDDDYLSFFSLDDDAVIRIAECCPRLKRLLLCSDNITDIAILRIAECCPML
jgi:hypothetical protein